MQIHDPCKLVESLCSLPRETGWVEFKENNFNPDSVGKYVSSLANSAMLEEQQAAYLLFGIKDATHEVIGTTVNLLEKKVGNEQFLLWLAKHLDPRLILTVKQVIFGAFQVEILCIDPGYRQPVKFKQVAYIRIGSAQQPLSDYPERERALWQVTSRFSFETSLLMEHLLPDEIYRSFSCEQLLKRLKRPITTQLGMLDSLAEYELLESDMQGRFQVSALMAILCARDFRAYSSLKHKGVRLLVYRANDKLDLLDDRDGYKGYLVTFEALLAQVMSLIPSREVIFKGTRTRLYDIPEPAMRELLANAVVHQDFTAFGSKPVIEIFKDRIKITNPGRPLVSVDRFIDTPSKTRNPAFAKIMREAGLCEQRGSGVDRAIGAIEKAALPPPLIEDIEDSTVVTVFMPRPFASMSQEERVRACFQHASLRYEQGQPMSNSSLRERFGLTERQYPQVSSVIRDAIAAGRIRPLNQDQGNRNARYVPYFVVS